MIIQRMEMAQTINQEYLYKFNVYFQAFILQQNIMKQNSITDYYFCEQCETYHHPNRKVNGEYLAACECQVLAQSDPNNSNTYQQYHPDSSLFKLSSSSQDFRRSTQVFDRSIISDRSKQHIGRSIVRNPQNKMNSNLTGIVKQKVISRNNSPIFISSRNDLNMVKNSFSPSHRYININNEKQKHKISINKPVLGGKLSPPISPRTKYLPMTPIIQEPSRQSRIPWPPSKFQEHHKTIPDNHIQTKQYYLSKQLPKIPKTKLKAVQLLNIGKQRNSQSYNEYSQTRYQDEYANTFLGYMSQYDKKNVIIQTTDQPQCCGKLCYY